VPPVYILSSTKVDGAINLPVIKTEFFDAQINIDDFDILIFTSKNGILGLDRLGIEWRGKPSIAIGEATAEAIEKLKGRVSFISSEAYGDELATEITKRYRFLKFLYPRAKEIASSLPDILRAKNADIVELIVYETVCSKEQVSAPEEGAAIVFSSPSTARCFFEKFGWRESYKCVAIGKTTAAAIDFCDEVHISPKQTLESAVIFAKNLS
jgi:uroporphyrinogen-III synthase